MSIPERYSKAVVEAMERHPEGRMSIRELSHRLGYSYEHVRKVIVGEPVGSEDFNARICAILGLDEAQMWELAQREKAERRFGAALKRAIAPPPDRRLAALWPVLSRSDRERVLQFAQALATASDRVPSRPGQRRT